MHLVIPIISFLFLTASIKYLVEDLFIQRSSISMWVIYKVMGVMLFISISFTVLVFSLAVYYIKHMQNDERIESIDTLTTVERKDINSKKKLSGSTGVEEEEARDNDITTGERIDRMGKRLTTTHIKTTKITGRPSLMQNSNIK